MDDNLYTLDDFDFDLPAEQVAQHPVERRDESRLMVLDRASGAIEHRIFRDIGSYLDNGDVLVYNDARVIPARMLFRRDTGATVEIIVLSKRTDNRWLAMGSRMKRLGIGEVLHSVVDPSVTVSIVDKADGSLVIESSPELTDGLLARIGTIPLPPYIRRDATTTDEERYQTVYASRPGAVAAPTAGLHFTEALLSGLRDRGVRIVPLTLFVSWGTFQPVREHDIRNHHMHRERYILPTDAAGEINDARAASRRVVAVGTTALRVLECTFSNGENRPGEGETDIFIHPPRRVLSADALITNFHTPRSTLLMLVSAFAGYRTIMDAYAVAVREQYRFFSYGDALLIR